MKFDYDFNQYVHVCNSYLVFKTEVQETSHCFGLNIFFIKKHKRYTEYIRRKHTKD